MSKTAIVTVTGSGKYLLDIDIEKIDKIVGMTKSLIAEYAKDGLRVNSIALGPTETPMVAAFYADNPEMKANAEAGIPQKRLGTPEEVAELVTFLLTSKAEYINGEVIRIDGGFTNTK